MRCLYHCVVVIPLLCFLLSNFHGLGDLTTNGCVICIQSSSVSLSRRKASAAKGGGLTPQPFETTSSNPLRLLNREVHLEHPDYPAFGKLGLKWGAVPSITSEGRVCDCVGTGRLATFFSCFELFGGILEDKSSLHQLSGPVGLFRLAFAFFLVLSVRPRVIPSASVCLCLCCCGCCCGSAAPASVGRMVKTLR